MLLKKIPKRSIVVYPEEFKYILSAVFSHSVKEGDFLEKFETKFKEYVRVKEAVAVSSGRFAMNLILKNLGLQKGDGVIISAYNFEGIPKMLLRAGFRPIFVDANVHTYQIDIKEIEDKIDSGTKAIVAPHLFGQPCDMDGILEIARKYNLFVIEDAAHSLGSIYKGRFTGAISDAGFFSFRTKTINTSFGGMVVTNNSELALKIRKELLCYDFPKTVELIREQLFVYIHALFVHRLFYSIVEYPICLFLSLFNLDFLEICRNIYRHLKLSDVPERCARFTNLQALIGMKQLNSLDDLVSRRKKIANALIDNLHPSILIQKIPPHSDPNYFLFPLKTKNKLKVFKKLFSKGIDSTLNYVSDCSYPINNTYAPIAKFLTDSLLAISLPFDLNEKELFCIAKVLNDIKNMLY